MNVGVKIRKIRELKGYSQEFIASELNITQSHYSRIEKNESDIKISRLAEIADALEVPVE